MELRKPKTKKKSCFSKKLALSLGNNKEITAVFNGQFLSVSDLESMNFLYEFGNFGKGTLSRGEPNYHNNVDDIPKIVLQNQFENHSKWNSGFTYSCPKKYYGLSQNFDLSLQSINNLLQSSYSDSDENFWKSWCESNNQEFDCFIKKNGSKNSELSLLEFKTDNSSYTDENFVEVINKILESRQLIKPKAASDKVNEMVIVNSSFSANMTEISPANMNSRLERGHILAEENLNLTLEESFFLKSQLCCLNIVDLSLREMNIPEIWEKFNAIEKNFKQRYVIYHYYRTKGWVVKSGLKFGGDFLLYKDGPAHYHSSYLIKVLDRRKKITWKEFVLMNRLVETFNKDLILCDVVPLKTTEDEQSFPAALTNNSVQEILVRRWFSSKERFSKEGDKCS